MLQSDKHRVARVKYKKLKDKADYKAMIEANMMRLLAELGKGELEIDKIRALQSRLKKELQKFVRVHERLIAC